MEEKRMTGKHDHVHLLPLVLGMVSPERLHRRSLLGGCQAECGSSFRHGGGSPVNWQEGLDGGDACAIQLSPNQLGLPVRIPGGESSGNSPIMVSASGV